MKLHRLGFFPNRISDPAGGADELADVPCPDHVVSALIRLAVVEPEAALI